MENKDWFWFFAAIQIGSYLSITYLTIFAIEPRTIGITPFVGLAMIISIIGLIYHGDKIIKKEESK